MKNVTAICLILTALLGLWGAARLHEQLWDYRARHQLLAAAPLENAPPLMAFTTVALGGFRGLIADLLWLRTIRLQQQGQIFEIAQLADWITKLEPHFTTVWAFQAWNMAYNISVQFPDAENRWRWVGNGIRLLRDEGLRYNPRNPNLYKELGWLYQHKIGYIMDPAHPFYKRKLAEAMQAVLHGAHLGTSQDADLKRLREELKLDPALMRQLDAEYGPFDWRLPETHAIYWSWRGRQMAPDTSDTPGTSEPMTVACACHPDAHAPSALPGVLACDQMMLQGLSEAFRQGRLDFDIATDLYVTTPRLDLLPQVMKAYEEAIPRYAGYTPNNELLLKAAYANFLGEAIVILHSYGRDAQAREIYQQVLRRYPDVDRTIRYDDFIRASFVSMQKNADDLPPPDAVAVVEGLLFQACQRKAAGDVANATEDERLARAFWDIYMQARASEDHRQRTGLPELDVLRRQAERRAQEERLGTDDR